MADFAAPVTNLKGIGRAAASAFQKLGVATVGDLLDYFPSGYEDFQTIHTVASAPDGTPLTLRGELIGAQSRSSWRRRRLALTEGIFQDSTGALPVVWFGRFPRQRLPLRQPLYLFGAVERYQGRRQLVNPAWELATSAPRYAAKLLPVYPLTAKLSQWQVRHATAAAVAGLGTLPDWLPDAIQKTYRLCPLTAAVAAIHWPTSWDDVAVAKRRLAFDELFSLQLSQTLARRARERQSAPTIRAPLPELARRLPVTLTVDQRRAAETVLRDLTRGWPMQRLLQGEVGSGKTMVAALAALAAAADGYQTLYLAPTDVLARQQYESLHQLLQPLGVAVALLTRTAGAAGGSARPRPAVATLVRDGQAAVVVGTHTLLQASARFKALGLVVVDEQHRFGVAQRLAAQRKTGAFTPHLLSMTATPIPRTLHLALCGDLDVSTLRTMPHGRRQIRTFLFGPADRRRVELAIRRRLARGEKVFVVCPLIDPSDKLGVKSAAAEYDRLRAEAFPASAIGLLHGRLRAREREAVLERFRTGALQVLVATTVVEVGLDIPEATVIVVEGAERFGLAQLHQLRGRVGRRGGEGICVLFTTGPASGLAGPRLRAFAATTDAFVLAEQDLKLRGPGEWFGTEQSGFPTLRVADLSDGQLVGEARRAVADLLADDPALERHRLVRDRAEAGLERAHAS